VRLVRATSAAPGGQQRIRATGVTVVGLGGLGSHTAQQLAYLGVENYGLVDFDIVTESSLNRLVGAQHADIEARTKKTEVAQRTIKAINPIARVDPVDARVTDADVEPLIRSADIVFGCLDRDLPRLQLTELCARYDRPLFDLASDVRGEGSDLRYGGRVVLCDGERCLVCLDLLDQEEIARDSMSPEQREAHERIYGVPKRALSDTGPMVVSINGAVASIAVTEFMALVTGLRAPLPHLKYFADRQVIRQSVDPPEPGCYYCTTMWGSGTAIIK
jgi:molybdopterin/thiamine biosynthesis adenylyltransferase